MNTNVIHVGLSLSEIAKRFSHWINPPAHTVGILPDGTTVPLPYIIEPRVLLSEAQWRTIRSLNNDDMDLSLWMDIMNREVDDREFERLLDEERREEQKWEEEPREDLYLGC